MTGFFVIQVETMSFCGRSATHGENRAGGFAQDHLGDATQQETLETPTPVRRHHDHVGFHFLFSV